MRLIIIPSDGAVYKDGKSYSDISWDGTPDTVHALQWFGQDGWVEFNDGTPNEQIGELPAWVTNALAAWDVADNPPPPPDPGTIIPEVVSMRQARLALLQVELLDEVEAAIANGTRADQITWEYATEVNRGDSLVSNMAAALGLSSSQLDSLFLLASTL